MSVLAALLCNAAGTTKVTADFGQDMAGMRNQGTVIKTPPPVSLYFQASDPDFAAGQTPVACAVSSPRPARGVVSGP